MTMTSPDGSKVGERLDHAEEVIVIERIKRKARARRLRIAQALAARIQIMPDGSRVFIRFTPAQRREHQLLLVTFTILAITGLLQRYSALVPVAWVINVVFGGVETLRTLHHLTAVVFIAEALYHLGQILLVWFVKRERGSMWPQWQDLCNLVQMVQYNLGLAKERPIFGRFNFEEKMEYWALLWGVTVMILTGLIQWFPMRVTLALPGAVIPVSRAIHGWEAVLAALSILIWHIYHTVIKEKNKSIFTGTMTEREMQETHPLEYRRILAAHDYLQKIAIKKSLTPSNNSGTDGSEIGVKHDLVQETRTI